MNHLLPVSIRRFKHIGNLGEMVYVTVQWIVFIKLHLDRLVFSYFIVQLDLTCEVLLFTLRKPIKKLHLLVLHEHIIIFLDLALVGQCVLRAAHHHSALGFSAVSIPVLRLELVQNIIDGWRPFIIYPYTFIALIIPSLLKVEMHCRTLPFVGPRNCFWCRSVCFFARYFESRYLSDWTLSRCAKWV